MLTEYLYFLFICYLLLIQGGCSGEAIVPPEFDYALVENDAANIVVIYFDKVIDDKATVTPGDFTVTVDGSRVTINSASLEEDNQSEKRIIKLTLNTSVAEGQAVTVAYKKSNTGSQNLQDTKGNKVVSFIAQNVENWVVAKYISIIELNANSPERVMKVVLNVDLDININDSIIISGLYGSETTDGVLTLGGADSDKFTTADNKEGKASWLQGDKDNDNDDSELVLTANQIIYANTDINFKFSLIEPSSFQVAVKPTFYLYVYATNERHNFDWHKDQGEVFGAVTKTISEEIVGENREMTVTLNVGTDINIDDIITISGLNGSGTTNVDLTLSGTDSAKFTANGNAGTAEWIQGNLANLEDGKLVLTANETINAETDIEFTFTIAEPMAAQSNITPIISITNNQGEFAEYSLSARTMTTDGVFGKD